VKWQFPRRAADKCKDVFRRAGKQLRRYLVGKGRRERFSEDLRNLRDATADRVGRRYERDDPIYTEPIHPVAAEAEERVLVRGQIDYGFLFVVIALCLFGAVMAFSASSVYAAQYHDESTYYLKKHLFFLAFGTGIAAFLLRIGRPWFWRFFGVASYAVSVILLLLVPIIGASYNSGATRWIQIGSISIQPSEIAKMAVIMVIALIMSKHEREIQSKQKFRGHFCYAVLYPMLAFGVICALVAIEHHLSGLIIIGLMGLVTMYIGGTHKKYFLWLFILGGVAVIVVLLGSEYAMLRVSTWLQIEFNSPNLNPLGSAWQTLQGLNAIGSGGFFGRGLGNSQQKYGYVSQPQNDFIFTIICEELGFVGALGVVLLFGLLIWRGYRIAAKAPDKFCSMVVYGLVTKVALQTILNIAVVTNSIPNTGIALPFFSSGGTSLIFQIIEMGIVLSISRYSYQKR
jgi:cell division protein FtsW